MIVQLVLEGNRFYHRVCESVCEPSPPVETVAKALFHRLLLYLLRGEAFFLGEKGPPGVAFCFGSFEFRATGAVEPASKRARGRLSLSRVVKALLVLRLLLAGQWQPVKKREVYYRLVTHFRDQQELDRLLAELCFLAGVPRRLLNVFPTAKGLLFGAVWARQGAGWDFLGDPARYPAGRSLDFDAAAEFRAQGQWVLVVEKESVFFDLLSSGFGAHCPAGILVTGRGYSDYTTKACLRTLFAQNPTLVYLYLGDFDPFGADILLNYLFGTRLSVAERVQLPFLCPLGLCAADCETLPAASGRELGGEDLARLAGLLSLEVFEVFDFGAKESAWQAVMRAKLRSVYDDLQWMRRRGVKFELEALGPNGAVLAFVCAKIRAIFN